MTGKAKKQTGREEKEYLSHKTFIASGSQFQESSMSGNIFARENSIQNTSLSYFLSLFRHF